MTAKRSGRKLLFFFIGGLVGAFGLASELLLVRGGVPRLAILLLSNMTIGAIAGTLFIQIKLREQEKCQIVEDRLCQDRRHESAVNEAIVYGVDDPFLLDAKALPTEATCRLVQSLPMNTDEIVAQLEAERDRLNEAIAALHGSHRGKGKGKRRTMSAAARKRISQAQKARWAKIKKAG